MSFKPIAASVGISFAVRIDRHLNIFVTARAIAPCARRRRPGGCAYE